MNKSRVLSEFRARFDERSLIETCSGEGCNVDMTGIPPERVAVNLENEFDVREKTEKRCDDFSSLFILLKTILSQLQSNSNVGKQWNQT